MTYLDAIKTLLEKAGDELTYPVNIIVHFFSANYIQFELDYGRNINEILDDKIENIYHIAIQWLNKQNRISSLTLDNDDVKSEFEYDTYELTIKYFNKKQFIKIDKDGKHRLLLYPLKENIEIEENGFVKQKNLNYEKYSYELESIRIPKFEDYKYKSLYIYDNEESFTNAILLEFIMRHINHNNLAPDEIKIKENIGEEEIQHFMEFQKIEDELNINLINIFGLSYKEITRLKVIYSKCFFDCLEEDNINIQLNSVPSFLKNIEINLTHSKKKLIEQIEMIKDDFDREIEFCLNLKQRVSKKYLDKFNEVLEKFPKSFEKKKDDLIKSLFIFDYIQATKLEIDRLNNEILEVNKIDIKEIEEVYKHDLNKKKQKLFENKEKIKTNIVRYPKMNLDKKESVFFKIGTLISEQPGQAKKLHNHIHKFLEQDSKEILTFSIRN